MQSFLFVTLICHYAMFFVGHCFKLGMVGKQKEVVKTRSPQIRWYPNMEAILVEVLLEELATGGKRADNGWRKESLKRTADEINMRLGMNCVSDNVRSRLKTMRLAWQVAKHAVEASGFGLSFNKETKRIDGDENAWESYVKAHPLAKTLRQKSFPYYDECCLIFATDYATGEGGNSGFDDDMVDGDDSRQTQRDGGDDSDAGESSAFGAPQMLVGILLKPRVVLSGRWAKIAEALKPEPQEEEVDQIDLLKDALQSLPDMNPELFLRSLDLLVENDRFIKWAGVGGVCGGVVVEWWWCDTAAAVLLLLVLLCIGRNTCFITYPLVHLLYPFIEKLWSVGGKCVCCLFVDADMSF
ncbi:hypothetical protein IFM89_014436 [Coptis chinensis]|uniref:Myb/SANT-like domain-containing protein n=1 Tax=Coptis chinensis TaxID=261450 RepID=A0A835I364_9MAGN|nr:hypothetical protein IFM89_014436 [Coptis chinensis]